MDQAIIFCRTKLDCDNVEQYLVSLGGGENALSNSGSISVVLAGVSFFVELSVWLKSACKGLLPIRMNVVFFSTNEQHYDQLDRRGFTLSRGFHVFSRFAQSDCFLALGTVCLFLLRVLIGLPRYLCLLWLARSVYLYIGHWRVYCCCCSTGPKAMVNEYSCVCLHSDRSPQERKANLQAFKVTIASYTTEVSAKIQLHTYNVIKR